MCNGCGNCLEDQVGGCYQTNNISYTSGSAYTSNPSNYVLNGSEEEREYL